MAQLLVRNFLGGMAVAAIFLGVALAGEGRGSAAAAATERPGCRVIIGIARDGQGALPDFAADHSHCRPVA